MIVASKTGTGSAFGREGALWTLGLAILVDSAWMLLAVPIRLVLIDRIVIAREERYLERKFGDEYLNYKRRVRRWI